MQIAIVDLGIGNLRSVEHALCAVAPNANVIVTADPSIIHDSDRVVLPGQGAIGTWFNALQERNLKTVLNKIIEEKPLLGICVGMQALFEHSDEDGGVAGLGLFSGSVQHFSDFHRGNTPLVKIPQMGWNQVSQAQPHPLWESIEDNSHFYFVHSYCANSKDQSIICGQTDYAHTFIAAAADKNVFAVQFHPEKSHRDGLQLLKNFTQWSGAT